MQVSPIKEMLLSALLWLPLCFFLWFYLASPIIFPVSTLAGWVMTGLFPDLILELKQFGYVLEVTTRIGAELGPEAGRSGTPVVALDINPMIYAYGLPLLAGLVMATPVSPGRRALQIGVGYLVLLPVQVWGVCWEILKILAFDIGSRGAEAVAAVGLNANAIALCYQFGYLILPAVTPVVVWILLNRPFLEVLVATPVDEGTGPGDRE